MRNSFTCLSIIALAAAAGLVMTGCPSGDDGGNNNGHGKDTLSLVWIPLGEFTMGSPADEPGRPDGSEGNNYFTHDIYEDQHTETLVSGFYIGAHPVTQAEFQAVMGFNPSINTAGDDTDNLPVDNVNMYHVYAFCNRLSVQDGYEPVYYIGSDYPGLGSLSEVPSAIVYEWSKIGVKQEASGYRVPTSAEWEYACRAGTTTAYNVGDTIIAAQANFDNDKGTTTPAGSYDSNAWGLYDMHGNVAEWTDTWHLSEASRIVRGGSYSSDASAVRSAVFGIKGTHARTGNGGFRVIRRVKPAYPSNLTGEATRSSFGYRSWVKTTIVMHNGKITGVDVDAGGETATFATVERIEEMKNRIIESNSPYVDTITSASYTAKAIREAGIKAKNAILLSR